MTIDGTTVQRILALYLAIYAAAIAVGLLATHNMAGALVHVGLLIAGALTLRSILLTNRGNHA